MDTIRLHDRDPRFIEHYGIEAYAGEGRTTRTLDQAGIALLEEAVAAGAPWVIPVRFKDELNGDLAQHQLYLIAQHTGIGVVQTPTQLVESLTPADDFPRGGISPSIEYRNLGPGEFFIMPLRKLERIWAALGNGKLIQPDDFDVPVHYVLYLNDIVQARTAEARAVRMVELDQLGTDTPDRPVKPRAVRPAPAPAA